MNFDLNISKEEFVEEMKKSIECLKETPFLSSTEQEVTFEDATVSMSVGQMIFFCIIAYPRTCYKKVNSLDFKEFISFMNSDKNKLITAFNNKTIFESRLKGISNEVIKPLIATSVELLADAAYAVNESFGNTTNLIDMLELKNSNKKVRDIIEMKLNEHSDYSEVVKVIKEANIVLMDEIRKSKNSFAFILSSISPGQFQQVFCAIGYKPEVTSSNIYPHCVNTNLLKGYRSKEDYFVSALGARKAAITNAIQVSTGGYLSRKMILLVCGQVNNSIEDCGSEKLVPIEITSEDIALRLRYRFAALTPNGDLFELTNENHRDFVGKRLYFRSPITCRVKNGVCKKCNGTSHTFNPFHSGISSVIKLTEQLIQRLLSSKHLLQINPKKIVLPTFLEEYLFVDKTSLISLKNFELELMTIEENSDDKKICTKFSITDEEKTVYYDGTDELEFLIDPILDQLNLKLKTNPKLQIFEDTEVFNVDVENSELVTPLKKIIKTLESEQLLNEKSYEDVLEFFLQQLSISGLDSSSLSVELILRELIRDPLNIQERPNDFSKGNYTFLRLTNALVNHPSLSISLAFERLSTVIEENIFNKSSPSLIDGLF